MTDTKDYLKQFLDDTDVSEVIQETGQGDNLNYTVVKFCKTFGITSGKYRIPSYLIYMVYRKYFTNVDNSAKIRPIGFFRDFNKLFKQVRSGKQRYYLINTDFDLEPKEWESFKESYSAHYFGVRLDVKKEKS